MRWRRERLPRDVKQALALRPAERILSAAAGDGYVVATDRALYVVDEAREDVVRLRWDLIDRATWEPPLMSLDVRRVPAEEPVAVSVMVDASSDVPAVVRDRVTNSIVVNSQVPVRGGQARVVARRNPDDGLLQWRIVTGAGVDPNDPEVVSATQAELRDLRARLGV